MNEGLIESIKNERDSEDIRTTSTSRANSNSTPITLLEPSDIQITLNRLKTNVNLMRILNQG